MTVKENKLSPGQPSQIQWGGGNWVFLDIGFANRKRSCGLLIGDAPANCVTFADARQQIMQWLVNSNSLVNLVIEAPMSVCFDSKGNPKGRSVEISGKGARYWYAGLGCGVMVAAMYLIRAISDDERVIVPVRLFEGFVSYKDSSLPSDHKDDVLRLIEIIRDPVKFSKSIYGADQLKQDEDDVLFSAFRVAGLDCGVPAVIKPQSEP